MEIENLKALIEGKKLNNYQIALAKIEFDKLIASRGIPNQALSMSGVSPRFSDIDIEEEANDRIFITEDDLTEREIFREGFVDGATWIRDALK